MSASSLFLLFRIFEVWSFGANLSGYNLHDKNTIPAHIESSLTNQGSKCSPADHHAINKWGRQVHLAHMPGQLDPDQPAGQGVQEYHQAHLGGGEEEEQQQQ